MQYSDGTNEEQDEIFDTQEDTIEYADYLVSFKQEWAEIFNLSKIKYLIYWNILTKAVALYIRSLCMGVI